MGGIGTVLPEYSAGVTMRPAAAVSSRISEREKLRRRNLLMAEQAVVSYQINQSLIGSRQECIVACDDFASCSRHS